MVRRALSIRHRLPLLISGLVLVVILVYGGAAYYEVKRSAVASAHERLVGVAGRLSTILGGAAERLQLQVAHAGSDPAIRSYLREPTLATEAVAASVLTKLIPSEPALVAVEIRDARGDPLLTIGAARPPELQNQESTGVTHLVSGVDTVAVGPFTAFADRQYFPVVSRVIDRRADRGYVVAWRQMGPADPNEDSALAQLIGPGSRFYLVNATGDLWTDGAGQVPTPPLDLATMRGVVEFEEPETGKWLAAAAPVASAPWAIVAAIPHAPILARARETLNALVVFGALLLAFAAAATWLLSGGITRPLAQLAAAAVAVTGGEYSRRVAVSRKDELGTVSTAFNAMTTSIAEGQQKLEHKVAELTRTEAEQRATQERLQHVLASSGAIIRVQRLTDGHFVTEWISENLTPMLGYEILEAMSPNWWQAHLHPDDHARLKENNASFRLQDGAREYRFRNKAGAYRWLREEQRIVRDAAGKPVEVIGALFDITDWRLLEEQFRQSQKLEAVGRLAGGVAHDFNNLLTIILGESELGMTEIEADHPVRKSLEQISNAGHRASLLTRRLLTFSRKQVIEPIVFDLNDLVADVLNMLARLIGEDVELETHFAADIERVTADKAQIEQVLVNLVVNARDAMPQGGKLILETSNVRLDDDYVRTHAGVTPGNYVMLAVSDTGMGMTDDVKAHLFEPFFTTKAYGKGTGLGLATCYAIARQFGGHLGVYSEVGVGTTMKLYLPGTVKRVELARPEVSATSARGTETILLVEDNSMVRAIGVRILEQFGYHVLEAEDGEVALHVLAAREGNVDLLLTDVVMPRMGGRVLAEKARALQPELRVLFASGYTDDVILQHQLLEQGIMILQKPFTSESLTARVRETLDRPPSPLPAGSQSD
jgi:PAS domain S-box-containing protein